VCLVIESSADRRRENLPTSDKLAVILPDEFIERSRQDIVLTVRDPARNALQLTCIDMTHAVYIPLYYVLLFPHSDLRWHYELRLREGQQAWQQLCLEQRPYYRYQLHVHRGEYPALFHRGRLF
jgi:hypothetical protein